MWVHDQTAEELVVAAVARLGQRPTWAVELLRLELDRIHPGYSHRVEFEALNLSRNRGNAHSDVERFIAQALRADGHTYTYRIQVELLEADHEVEA